MLNWALTFLVLALVAGFFGFGGVAAVSANFAQTLFVIFIILFTVARKFTAETGVPFEFITGGTIDRLNKEKLAKGNPESYVTFTTSHVGWLYANDGLFETIDTSKIPNAKNLADEAPISPYHLGAWAYVYTIGYRPDLIKDTKFESWNDLWKPEVKDKLAAPDFDPGHIIAVAAILAGADPAHWEKGEEKLKALKPNFKAFYTNDANSQQLLASGETPRSKRGSSTHQSMDRVAFFQQEFCEVRAVLTCNGPVMSADFDMIAWRFR